MKFFSLGKSKPRKLVAWITLVLFSLQPALTAAQVIVDANAPNAHRPTIDTAQNGTTVVQIAKPSAAGVSRNLYQQFDITQNGLILNNSYKLSKTQLAGYIQGNANLAGGSARIILNEVTGHQISHLRGYLEVAGQRADVIIANRNGIVGNGFGFINTNRGVLTTGVPVFGGGGSLEAFRVTGGHISVEGDGINASEADRVDLISRAVTVNAGIWAQELNAITGSNQVDYNTLHTHTITGEDTQPLVALDVSALGGMYANKIKLVGTEQGVGVNSQGTLSANSGSLTLTNEGKITLAGDVKAGGSININATDDITNKGTIFAQSSASIGTAGSLTNSGIIAATQDTHITAQTIASTGTLAAGIQASGQVGASGNLAVTTADSLVATGSNRAGGKLDLTGTSIDLTGANTYAGGAANFTATNGGIHHTGATLTAGGVLTMNATGSIANEQDGSGAAGQITAGQVMLTANDLSNQGGSILQTGEGITRLTAVNTFDNSGGKIASNGADLVLAAQNISNDQGAIEHAGSGALTIHTTEDLTNQEGSIAGNGQVTIQARHADNTQGTVYAQKQLAIHAGTVTNNQGTMAGGDKLTLNVQGAVHNQAGLVQSEHGLAIEAESIDNQSGTILNLDESETRITTTHDLQNNDGKIASNGSMHMAAGNLINNGEITSLGSLDLTVNQNINNAEGTLHAKQDMTLQAGSVNNTQGSVTAGDFLTITANAVNNTGGIMSTGNDLTLNTRRLAGPSGQAIAGRDITLISAGDFTQETGSQLKSNRNTLVDVNGTFTNQGNITAVGETTLTANKITNDTTGTVAAGTTLQVSATEAVNNSGRLDGKVVKVDSKAVTNTGTVTADTLTIDADNITNVGDAAMLASTGDMTLTVKDALANKDGATIYSLGDITIAGSKQRDDSEQPVDKANSVLNQSATIEAEGDIGIYAQDITNKKRIFETQQMVLQNETYPYEIHPTRLIVPESSTFLIGTTVSETRITQDSPAGKILAGNDMVLKANTVNNDSSWMLAGKSLFSNTTSPVNNTSIGSTRITTNHYYSATYYQFGGLHITDENYYDVSTSEQLPGAMSLFGGGQAVIIQAPSVNNIIKSPVNVTNGNVSTLPRAQQNNEIRIANGSTLNITLPSNSLYIIHSDPDSHYLVETDPRFANYSNFISSDYMLNQLGIDPSKKMKQIGDGFYEQQLIRDQIAQLTGRQMLSGYSSSIDEFKALMDNGASYAKQFNLTIGITLTDEQMTQLTSPMIWMEEQIVDGQKVLVPVVYLPKTQAGELKPSGALISADNVQINTTGNVTNTGVIKANNSAQLTSTNILNMGGNINGGAVTQITAQQDLLNQSGTIGGGQLSLVAGRDIKNETLTSEKDAGIISKIELQKQASITAGQSLTVQAGRDVTISGGQLSAGQDISLNAGKGIEVGSVVAKDHFAYGNYIKDDTTNLTSNIQAGDNVSLVAQQDTNLTGVQVNAGQDLTIKSVSGNVNIGAVKDEKIIDKKIGSLSNWKRTRTDDETVIGSTLQAGGNVKITAVNPETPTANGGNITIAGSQIYSDNGTIAIDADKDVTIQEVKEKHESLVQTHRKKRGTFSSKTTDTLDYSLVNEVQGSTISGDSVTINSGKDLTVKGSNVIGTNDIILHADDNITLTSAQETGKEEHYKRVKKSGLFSGGGFGFTIGKQTQTTTLNEQVKAEVGSTVGSLAGNVAITAGNDVKSAGTLIASGNDTNITGKNVTIDNTTNTYDSQYKYEFKQSGLSVSLGGTVIDVGTNLAHDINRAGDVQDNRLQALYGFKAQQDLKQLGDKLEGNFKDGLSINVSIGTSKTKFEQSTHVETVNNSNITAGGDVTITSTAGDVNLKATNINAHDVTLDTAENLNIGSAQNVSLTDTKTSSSSASLGASFGLSGAFNGITGSVGASKGKENQSTTTNTESVINAGGIATLKSGDDTNITGSQVKGEKVVAEVGGNLNIISQQDSETYTEKNKGGSIGFGTGKISGTHGSISTGKINSDYNSVIDQAGIFAGEDGFDIHVGKNTDLKGSVISSEATPDKNKISTDTLTWMDLHNKAKYSSSSMGVGYAAGKDANGKDIEKKNKGLTPNIGVTASGEAESTTQSAISPGTIEVRSNPNQDLSGLSRDTSNTLNALGKIFDKQTVQEQQELAGLFGEEVFKAIGNLGLPEGSLEKITLDAFAGGLMAKLGGGSFASGAAGAAFNQIVINELANIKDPALMQWASAVLGAAAAKVVGGNAQTGASTAVSETKNNYLTHSQKEALSGLLKEAMEKGASLDNLISVLTGFQEEGEKNAETANAAGNPYPEGSTIGDELSGLFQKSFGFDWDSSRSEEYNLNVLVNQLKSGQLVYNQQQAIDYIYNLPNDDQHWNSFEDTQKLIQGGAISTLFSLGIFELENGRILFKGPSKAVTNGSYKSLPDNAKVAYSKYNKDGWNGRVPGQTEGTKAGGTYKNRDGKLPTTDELGNPITYREYDVNNKIAGQNRDAERFVRGSDGAVYYTNDHYGTFTKVN
ncbi:hemagglutinin repeat-containing protein [Sporomusa sphaeroides]|jgi:filamentous hemagglutinin|uniref:hemagglutinin repeat-containing protein n=1 Tax=Sporomusa sphaeroides TaxID=47679 RepID=UPI003DA0CB0F